MLGVTARPADGWDRGATQYHISMLACVLRCLVAHMALFIKHVFRGLVFLKIFAFIIFIDINLIMHLLFLNLLF